MPYTLEESWAVLRESERITKEHARQARPVNARAFGGTKPPTPSELFLDYVVERQEEQGLTLPEAIRAVSIEKPDLAAAYREEQNTKRKHKARTDRDAAASEIRRRNR